jgi:CHAT domain-containing protein/tetratricopeptide (TPR) repeat protein
MEVRSARAGTEDVLAVLLALRSEADFRVLLEERPQILEEEAVESVLQSQDLPGYGTVMRALAALIREGREDVSGAWTRYERAMKASQDPDGILRSEVEGVQNALAEGSHVDALALIDKAAQRADSIGDGAVWAALQALRGRAILGQDGDRAELQESALPCFAMAASLSSGDQQTVSIIELAEQSIARIGEDPAENVEHALALMRLVMRELARDAPAWLRVRARQVLRKALLAQERGDRIALLREAQTLAEEDAASEAERIDAKLDRGAALEALAELEEVGRGEAETVFASLLTNDVGEWAQTAADLALGRLLRKGTDVSWEDQPIDSDEVPAYIGAGGVDNRPVLHEAREHLERACERLEAGPDRLELGRGLDELAEVLTRLGDSERALEVNRRALAILRPTSLPKESRTSARRLAMALGEKGEWAESAAAFRDATEAAELLYERRVDPGARALESMASVSLGRWAAFALAAAGDVAGAALTLEGSRARQLRRRIAPEAAGEVELDEEARLAYEKALKALRRSPLGGGSSDAARELNRVIAEIRRGAGHEDFARGARIEDFEDAAIAGGPLVYVNPTPFGTQLLFVERREGETRFENFTAAATSWQVLMRLMIGDLEQRDVVEGHPIDASYMAGTFMLDEEGAIDEATLNRRIEQLQLGLEEILPWLGSTIGQPLAAALRSVSAETVTLVPCGVIAHAPLEAILLGDELNSSLLDEFTVSFSPSALAAGEARRRSGRSLNEPPRLLCLADPTEDLPAAASEVAEVVGHFGAGAESAVGPKASAVFLEDRVGDADYVHLACHGQASLDPTETGVLLSDGLLEAAQMGGADLKARLVVVSACQSATADTVRNPEELFSMGTAILSAGAAAVIASLWPVDSEATALLMTKLYEEMMVVGLGPAASLRQAQLWLRELSEPERAEFLERHPSLAAGLRGQPRMAARRSMGAKPLQVTTQPFSHPDFWAGFIAFGI